MVEETGDRAAAYHVARVLAQSEDVSINVCVSRAVA